MLPVLPMARGIWPIRKRCMLRSRMPTFAIAVFLRCSSSVSPNVSNRRVRTRTHGGVAGVGGRPPPLCRSNRETVHTFCRISAALRQELNRGSDFVGFLMLRKEQHGRDARLFSIAVQFPKLDVK